MNTARLATHRTISAAADGQVQCGGCNQELVEGRVARRSHLSRPHRGVVVAKEGQHVLRSVECLFYQVMGRLGDYVLLEHAAPPINRPLAFRRS